MTKLSKHRTHFFRHWPFVAGLLLVLPFSTSAVAATPVKPAAKPVYKIKLNDTGITTCSDSSSNGQFCPIEGYSGQDAQYGRDKTANNDADGYAGFSFTKISSTGKPLSANAKIWNCVKDNVTGLMWEGKTDDGGLHDMDWTYSWYNPNNRTNGGNAGKQNGGTCMNTTECDTYAYVNAVNADGWCGYKDWRMPSRMELVGLPNLSFGGSLDSDYFPVDITHVETHTHSVWSSSPFAGGSHTAWEVNFYDSTATWIPFNKFNDYHVRLVRMAQ